MELHSSKGVCSLLHFINNRQRQHGSRPKPLKDTMQTTSHPKPIKALSQSLPKKQPRKAISPWQPQSGGLTREEIRAIIIDQIG